MARRDLDGGSTPVCTPKLGLAGNKAQVSLGECGWLSGCPTTGILSHRHISSPISYEERLPSLGNEADDVGFHSLLFYPVFNLHVMACLDTESNQCGKS